MVCFFKKSENKFARKKKGCIFAPAFDKRTGVREGRREEFETDETRDSVCRTSFLKGEGGDTNESRR